MATVPRVGGREAFMLQDTGAPSWHWGLAAAPPCRPAGPTGAPVPVSEVWACFAFYFWLVGSALILFITFLHLIILLSDIAC